MNDEPLIGDQQNGARIEMNPANAAAVSALEQLLTRAKRGEVHGFLLVGINAQGFTFEVPVCGSAPAAVALIGATEVMKTNIVNMLLQARAQQPGLVRAQQVPDATGLFRR
jgi:hypothetical protein